MAKSAHNQNVYYEVATCRRPYTGFLVVCIDLSKPSVDGIEAVVVSQHEDRDVAESEALRLAGRQN